MGAHDLSHHRFHRIRVVLKSNSPAAGLGFYPTDSERKVLNFARECKKLNEQIAATSVCCDAGVKSKLVKRLEQVEKQIRMFNSVVNVTDSDKLLGVSKDSKRSDTDFKKLENRTASAQV